jgi:hypothetical protein
MRVVINSDMLFTTYLVQSLPAWLERFAKDCRSVKAPLVVVRTALLEIERHQAKLAEQRVAACEDAKVLLAGYGIDSAMFSPSEVVRPADIVALLRATGAKLEVIEPTLSDFEDAQRRAALHLPPLPPKSETDEMRDLVIWSVACRLAKSDGGAILLSRDKVHTGVDGDAESSAINLHRVSSFDLALDLLGVGTLDSPRAKLAISVLDSLWPAIREGLPLPVPPENSVRRLGDLLFVQGEHGLARVAFSFRALTVAKKTLAGRAEIESNSDDRIEIAFHDLAIEGVSLDPPNRSLILTGTLPATATDLSDRVQDLREALAGQ